MDTVIEPAKKKHASSREAWSSKFDPSARSQGAFDRSDVASTLGLPEDGVAGLAEAGLIRRVHPSLDPTGRERYRRADVYGLIEMLRSAAILTGSDAFGMSLVAASIAAGFGVGGWAVVLSAVLTGKINVFRRPGAPAEPVLESFLVPSERVLDTLAGQGAGTAPRSFMWTPTAV